MMNIQQYIVLYTVVTDVKLCYYLHGKGGYVFGNVCLSVSNITQNVMNGLGLNFMEGSGMAKGRTDKILVAI